MITIRKKGQLKNKKITAINDNIIEKYKSYYLFFYDIEVNV